MVKLDWENKTYIHDNIEDFKKRFKDRFTEVKIKSNYDVISSDVILDKTHWVNKIFWAENLEVLCHLLNFYEGKIDLIYIDPPFFSGVNYHIKIKSSDSEYNDIAYYDHWNKDIDSYLQNLFERISLMKELLSKKGLIFVHLDWHSSHYVKLILDEIFGESRFVNSIIWYYYNKYSAGKVNLPRAHDDILVYSKSNKYTFNEIRTPRKNPRKQLKRIMVDGVLKNAKDKNGKIIYRIVTDKKIDDVWKIPCMQPASKEWTGFPTQKHHKLLERIIRLGSNEGDLVADFFCGSGTTLLAAENLNRRWIGCDISEYSIHLSYRRMMELLQKKAKDPTAVYKFQLFTLLDEKRKELIEKGFFEKKLLIERKK